MRGRDEEERAEGDEEEDERAMKKKRGQRAMKKKMIRGRASEMRNLVRKCRGIGGVSVAKVSSSSAISTSNGSSSTAITSTDHDHDHDHDHIHVVGVMTRARRALAMAPARSGEIEKRRKIDHCNSTNSSELQFAPSYVQIRTRPRPLITAATENSPGGDDPSERNLERCNSTSGATNIDKVAVLSRCCSSNGSSCELAHEKSSRFGSSDLGSECFEFDNYSSAARVLGCTTDSTTPREKSAGTPKFSDLEAESDDLDQARRPSAARRSSSRRGSEEMAPSEAELDEFFTVAESAEKKRFTEKYNFDVVKDVPLKGRYEWVQLKP
ncbi:hypothetical protein Sjap_017225 [Stephania japonica]|uniref:Cyclin-dependent kinase inhibitor domain-containing protein n=1 Tax=Stephania japonica TaxID=461633 RepID=A0AAP0NK42_9MAGN